MTIGNLIFWLGILALWGVFVFHAASWLDKKIDVWVDKIEKRWLRAKKPYFWDNR